MPKSTIYWLLLLSTFSNSSAAETWQEREKAVKENSIKILDEWQTIKVLEAEAGMMISKLRYSITECASKSATLEDCSSGKNGVLPNETNGSISWTVEGPHKGAISVPSLHVRGVTINDYVVNGKRDEDGFVYWEEACSYNSYCFKRKLDAIQKQRDIATKLFISPEDTAREVASEFLNTLFGKGLVEDASLLTTPSYSFKLRQEFGGLTTLPPADKIKQTFVDENLRTSKIVGQSDESTVNTLLSLTKDNDEVSLKAKVRLAKINDIWLIDSVRIRN